jgi:hypothetical protein
VTGSKEEDRGGAVKNLCEDCDAVAKCHWAGEDEEK